MTTSPLLWKGRSGGHRHTQVLGAWPAGRCVPGPSRPQLPVCLPEVPFAPRRHLQCEAPCLPSEDGGAWPRHAPPRHERGCAGDRHTRILLPPARLGAHARESCPTWQALAPGTGLGLRKLCCDVPRPDVTKTPARPTFPRFQNSSFSQSDVRWRWLRGAHRSRWRGAPLGPAWRCMRITSQKSWGKDENIESKVRNVRKCKEETNQQRPPLYREDAVTVCDVLPGLLSVSMEINTEKQLRPYLFKIGIVRIRPLSLSLKS